MGQMVKMAVLIRRKPVFDPRPVRVKCVVDRLGLQQVLWKYDGFLCQYHSTNLHLHVFLTGGTHRRSLGTFQKAMLLLKSGTIG